MEAIRNKRPGLAALGVYLAAIAIIGAIAVGMIRPVWVAIAVTAIVGLLMVGIGSLPYGMKKRAARKATSQGRGTGWLNG